MSRGSVAGGALLAMIVVGSACAEEKTAYIETPAERAAHAVVLNYSKLLLSGRGQEAMEKYLAPDYVEHSHLVQMVFKKKNTGREDTIRFFSSMMGGGGPGGPGGAPMSDAMLGQFRVNDEIVTQYGPEGADIFRVVNGKITDHWDASPMERVVLPGENNLGGREGGPGGAGGPGAATAAGVAPASPAKR